MVKVLLYSVSHSAPGTGEWTALGRPLYLWENTPWYPFNRGLSGLDDLGKG